MKPRSTKPRKNAVGGSGPKTARPKQEPREEFVYEPYQQKSPLEISPDLVKDLAADGYAIQWVAEEVMGQPIRDNYAKSNGWEPVLKSDWGGVLARHSEPGAPDGPITQGGLTLMARAIEIHRMAKQHEKGAAAEKIEAIRGLVDGLPVSGGRHKSALNYNKMKSTMERLTIPDSED
jgi:hypothetical protein